MGRVGNATAVLPPIALALLFIFISSFFPYPPYMPYLPYPPSVAAQDRNATDAMARRVDDRIRALQAEAGRLATQARTLLGDLRQLEIQRDLAAEKVKAADAAVVQAQMSLAQTTERLSALDEQRIAQLPDLTVRLVDIYKRGRGGYARMLLDVRGVREFARAARAVAALTTINDEKIAEHRRTLAELRQQRDAMAQRARELEAAARDADRARLSAQRAVAAREALIAEIDERRDLNAQLAGELDVAYQRLQGQLANLAAGRPAEGVPIPMASFRGALDWPVTGRVMSGFTAGGNRPAGAVRNGIEIGAADATPVTAVHPGTVDYADQFSGFGNLVIVDHGEGFLTVYGNNETLLQQAGERVDAGEVIASVGNTGGNVDAGLYFEIRFNGRPIDPLRWMAAR